MKKKWIIPAIIVVVLVAIALFIAAYPILLFVAATDESIKQLNNSYINSDYQGWHEVTFFDKHHFSLPDTWRIAAIDDTTYCIYAEDAQVIAYVGKLGRYVGMDSFCNETIGTAEVLTQSELFVGVHFGNGCYMYQMTAMMPDTHQEDSPMLLQMLPLLLTIVSFSSEMMFSPVRRCRNMLLLLPIPMNWTVIMLFVNKQLF